MGIRNLLQYSFIVGIGFGMYGFDRIANFSDKRNPDAECRIEQIDQEPRYFYDRGVIGKKTIGFEERVKDIDGDGLSDMVEVRGDKIVCLKNMYDTMFYPVEINVLSRNSKKQDYEEGSEIITTDLNKDGRIDLCVISPSGDVRYLERVR